ncbi:unnamed protein product [Oppiella nova]|uniref:Uncharacterized protein n=1 Tax=Oppiella nova TaxID=334625 RepID=A0A7R9LYV7_9ACAR|nr:unnamed protein product [Oppiella nova]CAG2168032.1 unnamed protein product [Oppiella nova]
MHLNLQIIVLMTIFGTIYGIVCPTDYCQSVDCANNVTQTSCENQNGIYTAQGTFCGCCPACLTKLEEGQSCRVLALRGVPPTSQCAPGLKCDTTSGVCVKI